MLRGIGRPGAGSGTIFSQRRQDFLIRAIPTIVSSAASLPGNPRTVSPMTRTAPPLSGQGSPGSRARRSRGVLAAMRGRRRGFLSPAPSSAGAASAGAASAGVSSGGVSSASARATCRSSSAGSGCPLSRPVFSGLFPKGCLFSLAIRARSARTRRSCRSWAQAGRDLRALRLQGGGVAGQIRGRARPDRVCHASPNGPMKTGENRRTHQPARAGGAPRSGRRPSIPAHDTARCARPGRRLPSGAIGPERRPVPGPCDRGGSPGRAGKPG